jgi:type IV pilus assembly protein PilW
MSYPNKNGFTLIELLVAMGITSIVMLAVISTYTVQVRSKNTQEALTDMNQAARAVLEIMTSEIRMAGFDPTESAGAGIVTADTGELIFSMDRVDDKNTSDPDDDTNAPDGDCCGPNEQIRFKLKNDADNDGVNDDFSSGVECHLGRETGSGLIPALGCGGSKSGLQPLARNIDVLNFVYLDNTGAVISTPVAANRLEDIRAIEVTIVARAGTESRGFFSGNYTNNEAYYNLRETTPILSAQGDGFRRLRLATTILCRNVGL